MFRVYYRFRYPTTDFLNLLKPKQSDSYALSKSQYEYSVQQLKKRYEHLARADRAFQTLFQALREVRDLYFITWLGTVGSQKFVSFYFYCYLIKILYPSIGTFIWGFIVQGVLFLLNLLPLMLKNFICSSYITVIDFLPRLVFIGILMVFTRYINSIQKKSASRIFEAALAFWIPLGFGFFMFYLLLRHPIVFIISKELIFTFKPLIAPDQF